jgi:hypothetical protein
LARFIFAGKCERDFNEASIFFKRGNANSHWLQQAFPAVPVAATKTETLLIQRDKNNYGDDHSLCRKRCPTRN